MSQRPGGAFDCGQLILLVFARVLLPKARFRTNGQLGLARAHARVKQSLRLLLRLSQGGPLPAAVQATTLNTLSWRYLVEPMSLQSSWCVRSCAGGPMSQASVPRMFPPGHTGKAEGKGAADSKSSASPSHVSLKRRSFTGAWHGFGMLKDHRLAAWLSSVSLQRKSIHFWRGAVV